MTDNQAQAAAIAARGAALRRCTTTNQALVTAYNDRDQAIHHALELGATIHDIAHAAVLPPGTVAAIAQQ